MTEIITELGGIILLVLITFEATRRYYTKAKKALRETAEALVTISDAIDDDKLTREEIIKIKKEFLDIIKSHKDIQD